MKKKIKSKAKRTSSKKPVKRAARFSVIAGSDNELWVNQELLFHVRNELKEDISSVKHELKAEIHGLRSEFGEFRSELESLKSGQESLKSSINNLTSEFHQMRIMTEQQNARNMVVYDGLTSLFARQDRVEARVDSFEKMMLAIKGN